MKRSRSRTRVTSLDFRSELACKLEELAPEAFADGKVDVVKLKELLGEDASDDSERFGLFWPGKKRALRAAQEPTTATLKPVKDKSKYWDTTQNAYIEGDNLEVLKILQKNYHNRIKMIYIDPPYNKGKDFIYPDNYIEGLQSYLEFTKQVDEGGRALRTNSESEGRYHSNWLNMMYPRLKLARNLMTDDGVIFISIDDNEVDNLTKLCNEIFGENNFLARLPRVTKKAGKSGDLISYNHDYVVAYARSNHISFNRYRHTDSGFKYEDNHVNERGRYKLNQTLDYGSIQYSRSLDYEIEIRGITLRPGGASRDGMMKRRERNPRTDWCWRWSPDLYKFGLDNDFIVLKEGKNGSRIYTKTYENAKIKDKGESYEVIIEDRTKAFTTLDFIDNRFSNDNAKKNVKSLFEFAAFDYTKPVELIKTLAFLSTSPDSNDIVLDFFSGSGTTAHAVMQLNAEDGGNRRHIQVQLPEPTPEDSEALQGGYKTIPEIACKRIDLAGDKISANVKGKTSQGSSWLDIGYRTYKLSDTNFAKWKVSSDTDRAIP